MTTQNKIQLFEQQKVRSVWDDQQEKWFVSIVDVIAVLTDSPNPQVYWRVFKKRLLDEGNQTVTNCNGLKMLAPDGKMRMTDVADIEQLFRLIQSIPSPKAEPFKLWLAHLGRQRLDQLQDPELSIEQAIVDYRRQGHAEVARQGGTVARNARLELEQKTGQKVVTSLNAKNIIPLEAKN
jgi:hypothetical protein